MLLMQLNKIVILFNFLLNYQILTKLEISKKKNDTLI